MKTIRINGNVISLNGIMVVSKRNNIGDFSLEIYYYGISYPASISLKDEESVDSAINRINQEIENIGDEEGNNMMNDYVKGFKDGVEYAIKIKG